MGTETIQFTVVQHAWVARRTSGCSSPRLLRPMLMPTHSARMAPLLGSFCVAVKTVMAKMTSQYLASLRCSIVCSISHEHDIKTQKDSQPKPSLVFPAQTVYQRVQIVPASNVARPVSQGHT